MIKKRALYKHQREAFKKTKGEANALFLDMRLGKTLICIRRCLTYKPLSAENGLKFLIVAPNSAIGSWEDDLAEEGVKYCRLLGTSKQRWDLMSQALTCKDAMFILTNRESYRSIGDYFLRWTWDAVVLDESHFVKNPKAKVTKFYLKYFRTVPHRWILTGTPSPESDTEWFCQMAFLYDSFMGCDSFWHWRAKYLRPGYSGHGWIPKKGVTVSIQRALADKAIIMRRKDVGMDVPRTTMTRTIQLQPKIRKAYKKLENEFILEIEGKEIADTMWAGAKFQLLRQVCSGRLTTGEDIHNGKRKEILELITNNLKNDPVIVWCCYRQEIEDVQKLFKKAKRKADVIHGGIKPAQREVVRRKFMSGGLDALILQYQTAEAGMCLSRSDTNIYFTEPPGYLAWSQTRDRVLDIHQKTPILDISLVVENSVDSDLHDTLKIKSLRNDLNFNEILKQQMHKRRRENG